MMRAPFVGFSHIFTGKRSKIIAMVAGPLLLTACAHAPPKPPPIPKIAAMPVPVACVPKSLPPRPDYPFTLAQILNADGPERYRMLGANYVLMMQRLSELEPLTVSCGASPPTDPPH